MQKEKAVKRLPKGWNVTADEVLLSRLTNYLGESKMWKKLKRKKN